MLLHSGHLLDTLLHLLDLPLLTAGVQDILHRVFLVLHDTVGGNPEVLVLDELRHDLLLDGACVLVRIDTEGYLLLQFCQFFTAMAVLQQVVDQRRQFRIEGSRHRVPQCEHPPDESALTHIRVGSLLIHMHQRTHLPHVEIFQQRQHDGTHDKLLVVAVDGRREQQLFHGRGHPVAPDI